MNNKFLSILVCIAMLVSCLSVYTYAVDVEIDLSDLFGDPPATDDGAVDTGDNSGNASNDNSGNGNGSTSRPGSGNKNNNEEDTSDNTEKDGETPSEWVNPYSDVKESDWYYETVKYVSENGIFNGMTEDTFVPGGELTRAMLVTVLYRVEGTPRLSSDSTFSDVELGDWYGPAVIWAAENGIVNGISETEFAPNTAITREQIATIMYRYAQSKDYDTTQGGMAVREYEDYETISSWAMAAMQWAVNTQLINGKTATTVNPQDKATRAEAATIIMRFIEANK